VVDSFRLKADPVCDTLVMNFMCADVDNDDSDLSVSTVLDLKPFLKAFHLVFISRSQCGHHL